MALSRFFQRLFKRGDKKKAPLVPPASGKELSQQDLDKVAGAAGKQGDAHPDGITPPQPWPPK